jgi:hypothetical protein
MWRGYRGNRLPPCFPTDVYDRYMATDIWLIQPYVIAWEKARPYVIAWKKDLSYSWYIRIYTKYILGFILNTLYASVYDSTYQVYGSIQAYMTVYTRFLVVYKRLCRYILMTCKYILVYTIPLIQSTVTSTATGQCCNSHESHHIQWTPIIYRELPSYTVTSLYVQGMIVTILSICKNMEVYVGISQYMRVYAPTKHFDKMYMTPGFEPWTSCTTCTFEPWTSCEAV